MSSRREETAAHKALLKFEAEIDQPGLSPVDDPQIEVGANLANLIANPMRHHGSLRVIEHDTLFFIEPAFAFVDLGDNRIESQDGDFVGQYPSLCIERLA